MVYICFSRDQFIVGSWKRNAYFYFEKETPFKKETHFEKVAFFEKETHCEKKHKLKKKHVAKLHKSTKILFVKTLLEDLLMQM